MSDEPTLLGKLAEEFTRKVREGKSPDIEDYACRYPELANRIRELFPTLMVLEGMAGAETPSGGSISGPLNAGSDFANYRIVRELGRGGMGIVYEAKDTHLCRNIAIKIISQSYLKDSQALKRFQGKARVAAALEHPYICTIHEIGEFEGQPFIAMELLSGQTLKQRLGGNTLEIDEIVELGIQLADALDAAHSKGIVHRDIKPGNIIAGARNRRTGSFLNVSPIRAGGGVRKPIGHRHSSM